MPVDPNDPRYLPTLRRALCNMAGATERWAALASRGGATDEELTARLNYELSNCGGSFGPGWLGEVHAGSPPRVWISAQIEIERDRSPDVYGARLLALTRKIFAIGYPAPADQLNLFARALADEES